MANNSHHQNGGIREASTPPKLPYPKSVIFIIGNEFCERFSYYGMRTILVLYFHYVLQYSENNATLAFHIFAMCCYFTPVFGAIIADSYLGKFWTILSISLVYAAGNIVLSFASIGNGNVALTIVGLLCIAFGTGGIKPCVSAFGGDQFAPSQAQQLQRFFSLFYVSINAGGLISTFLTPVLREDVSCFDRSDCYPLAFGVPAILMVTAVALFIGGRFLTNYRINPPAKDNVIVMVCKCVCRALGGKFFRNRPKKDHWLEYADDAYDAKTINDVKALMSVLFLYLPLPIFWSLFDQQGSRWTLQAIRMNGHLGGWTIEPDQIQVVNPLLVIFMIPVYDYAIYPFLAKIKTFNRPLQRMTIGGILAAISFLICGIMQLKIEQETPVKLLSGHNHVAIVNDFTNCTGFSIESPIFNGTIQNKIQTILNVPQSGLINFEANFDFSKSENCPQSSVFSVSASVNTSDDHGIVLLISDRIFHQQIDWVSFPNFMVKPEKGGAMLFTVFNLENFSNQTISVSEKSGKIVQHVTRKEKQEKVFGFLEKFEVAIKSEDISMKVEGSSKPKVYKLDQGATYIQVISGDVSSPQFELKNIVEGNKLSVFLQVIQYFVITCAEVMFSITGLEFSYSQAPKSMKSVLQAAWLLTVAFGNAIIAIIADLTIFENQSAEFFFFAGLMTLDIAIFAIMAYYYKPYKPNNNSIDNNNNSNN